MRHLLLTAAALVALGAVPVTAADEHEHEHAKTGVHAGKAVNKVDPLSGDEVDARIATLELAYEKKGEKKTVVVGFSSDESLAKAKAADEKTKALIAQAAKTHKLVKDGELVELAKHHKKDQ